MASESSKVNASKDKFILRCLDNNRPSDLEKEWYFVDGNGKLFVAGFSSIDKRFIIKIQDKANEFWTEVQQNGEEWPTIEKSDQMLKSVFFKENTCVFMQCTKSPIEVWFFDTKTLAFKQIEVSSDINPPTNYYNKCSLIVLGCKLIYNVHGYYQHFMLDLDQVEHTGKGNWEKFDYFTSQIWWRMLHPTDNKTLWGEAKNQNSVWKIDFMQRTCKEVGVSHPFWPALNKGKYFLQGLRNTLLFLGMDKNNKLRILSTDTSGHQDQQPLTSNLMVPADQTTSRLVNLKFFWIEMYQVGNGEEIIFATETDGKRCIFGLKISDKKDEMNNDEGASNVQGLTDYMRKILSSGDFSDMTLIVGQNKTRIPLHKNIAAQSPWIKWCLKGKPVEGKIEIEILECEQEEVSLILDHIYTGNFKRPRYLDWKAWMKLWKASIRFEMLDIARECLECIPEDLVRDLLPLRQSICKPMKMKQCAICFQDLVEPFQCLIPCGHTDTCYECIGKIRKQQDFQKCPICKSNIANVNNVYF